MHAVAVLCAECKVLPVLEMAAAAMSCLAWAVQKGPLPAPHEVALAGTVKGTARGAVAAGSTVGWGTVAVHPRDLPTWLRKYSSGPPVTLMLQEVSTLCFNGALEVFLLPLRLKFGQTEYCACPQLWSLSYDEVWAAITRSQPAIWGEQ